MKSVRKLESCYEGQTVYIVASGPSIRDVDLKPLQNKPVLLVNGAIILLDKYSFEECFFVTTDKRFLVSEQNKLHQEKLLEKGVRRLLRSDLHPLDSNKMKKSTYYIEALGRDGFSKDLELGFYFGCTSVMLAIQSAWYFGAKKVVLLGVDLTQIMGEKRFYREETAQPVDPFFGVQAWNIANACREFERSGKQLVGVSKHSLLRPYIPYEAFDGVSAA